MKIKKIIAAKEDKNIFFILLFFLFLGIFLRYYQLNFENYWWDEMLGFWTADPYVSFDETISRHRNHDQTSIIFHLIAKNYYNIFGYNPEFGRYISFFFWRFINSCSRFFVKTNKKQLLIFIIGITNQYKYLSY